MKISHIREAPLIRAYLLIDQEKNKKGFKAIQPEITKMSEVFGIDFDRNLHLFLFNDIDFKDLKNLQNPKKRKIQYFLQEFPQFIERQDFIEIFSRILMDTKNTGSANEIFNGLNKICKLNIENQMKLIICFFMCDVEKYQKEAKNILLEKCKEIYKDKKLKNLTESTVNTILTVLDIVNDDEENDDKNSKKSQIEEYTKYFLNYDEEFNPTSADDIPQISDLDKILDTGNEDPIELEKLIIELGPFIINNGINVANSDLINSEINEKSLSNFIIFMLNNSTIKFDDDLKELNKIFLESLNMNEVDNIKDYKSLLDEQLNKDLKWDLDKIYDLFKSQIQSMDVNNILNSFDDPSFSIKAKKTFDFLIEILFKLHIFKEESKNNIDIFFNNLIFNKWDNEINQIEFIDFMINNKEISENSQFALKKYDGTKISDDLINKTKPKQNTKNNFLIENWRITDLTKCLLNLSKGEFYNSVKEIFKWPIQNIPELFSLVLVNITPEADAFLYDELIYEVIPQILTDKNPNQKLIDEIWNTNKELIISIIAKMWENDTDIQNLTNIFEIANTKLNESLQLLVNSKYYDFSVNLGIFAAKRESLNLEQWLKERINKVGDEFLEALLDYIKKNLIQQTGNTNNKCGILEKAQLNLESLAIILDNIIRSRTSVKLSQKTQKYIQEIYKSIFEIYDELQVQPVNSEEIEKESTQLLNSMFNGEISVDDVINKLINYKKSSVQKENEIYALSIHSIFDEYRFLNQYPEKENKIMAELFGKAINNKLIDGIIKTIALKFILEGIKTGKGPLYNFGTIALSQFIDKISIWPNFMNSLIEVPQIKNEKELYQKLLQQFNENKNKEKGQNEGNEYTNEKNAVANSKNNDTNISKQYDNLRERLSGIPISFAECENINSNNNENSHSPSEEIMKKIQFLFGSVNKNNMKEKIKELKNILKEEKIIKWFSQFFVTKKLISENSSSFQMYDEILNQIDNKDLNKQILKDIIFYFHCLISPENIIPEKKTKEILKNLGTWLGISLISKNRPIFAKDLDFKELIFNSYENGKLCIIIPFICKVFKYVSKSKVFHTKNPWINAILCLLWELCNKSSIDNSIKDEIKSLFKAIDVDTNSLTITKDLEKYHVKKTSQNFYKNRFEIDQKYLYDEISELEDYINNLLGIFNSDPNFNVNCLNRRNSSNSENSSDNLTIQSFIIKFLMKIMTSSLQQALQDVIDSSVKTSINTAITIVNKDFMFEKNENKYIAAIENTMKILVKSLSDVNSRDKLKTQVDSEFEKYLKGRKLKDDTVTKIKQQPNSEFLHIGLKYIQKEISKVAPKILHDNPIFKEEIEKRKQNNKSLVDSKDYKKFKEKIKNIPTELQPNENNISDNAYKIYENFGKIYDTMNSYEDNTKYTFLNTVYRILKEVLDNMGTSKAKYNNYDLCMKNIENVSEKADSNYNDDQQLVCIEKIINESKITDVDLANELSLNTLKYAINSAKNNNSLLLNVYSFILKGWVKLHSQISTEITKYLLAYDDIFIRYKYEIHSNFIKKKLIDYEIYENYFLDLLSNNEVDLLARDLLQKIYNIVVSSNKSNKSNKSLLKGLEPYYIDKNSNNFFSFFKSGSQFASYVPDSKLSIKKLIDQNNINQLNNFMHQFETLIYFSMKSYDNFDVNKLRKEYNFFAKNSVICEEKFSNFLQYICTVCINGPPEGLKIKPILCLTKNVSVYIYYSLYACIVKKDKTNKLKIFSHILQGIYSYFHKDYTKNRKNFDQRAYYKLFYNLIYLIDQNPNEENILDSDYPKINYLLKIIDLLKLISPLNYQLFTMAWLDLLSANHFISNFLETPLHSKKKEKTEKYEKYCLLIIDILSYLDSLGERSINHYNYVIFLNQIYKFFFFLCNTYPEFVSNYYHLMIISLSNNLSNYLQLKNMILSTVPNSFNAEIPINDDEQNSQQQEAFEKSAIILADKVSVIEKSGHKELIDKYINDPKENYLDNFVKTFDNIESEKEINKILNIIVIYWGLKHKSYMTKNKIKSKEEFYKFYSYLLINLNKNVREVLIHALLNALRYPCMQTESYSILYQELFLEINNEEIKEHLLNNLLQRLLYKPYPWGIRYTLVNLAKKEKFKKMIKNYSNDKNNIMDIIEKMTKVAIEYKENNLVNFS